MDFEFSDEQRQLREAVEGFAAKEYTFDRLRAIKRSGAGWDPAVWRGLAELGVAALNVPASLGGLGYGPTETLALMDACGPQLLLEPILTSAVIATAVLRQFEGSPPAEELLRHMAAGDRIAALAHFEPASRFDTRWVETRASETAEGFRLDGQKAVVAHAGIADVLLVSARSAGAAGAAGAGDGTGVSLFLVPRTTSGLTLAEYLTLDGQRAADVRLDAVRLPKNARLGGEGQALEAVETALDLGLAALCAEAVSIMQALVRATVEYLNTRQQFGQPIGRFQALQHRVADMAVHLEQARSMSYLAAMRCESFDSAERRRALSAAKVVIAEAARFVGQQSVQLHGGMGMTDELKVSHWFKRLTAIEILFGDADFHLQRFASSTGGAA
jgi:alkylation response protein AidB-like acyl-CoA dehydrogenase